MFRGIEHSDSWSEITPVTAGWSGDEEYRVHAPEGELLLRITAKDKAANREREFQTLRLWNGTPLNIPRAVRFGPCEGGVYTLLTWVEGQPAEELLPSLSVAQQRRAGEQAGAILRQLHARPAPEGTPDWAERFGAKMRRKVELYRACPHSLPSCDDFERYVLDNAALLNGRPSTFQHGDYHVGNMVLDAQGRLGVVDFDRMDWGDPWEELNRITWCVESSPAFASAMLRAYFGGEVPDAFWPLLALYIASNQLSSIPWATPFGQEKVDVMVRQCEEVRAWYPGAYGATPPNWYC